MPASRHGASGGIPCRTAMCILLYLAAVLVAAVLACPAARAVSPAVPRVEPEPQPFSFAVRDPRYVARVSGVRVPMYAPGARWRVVAASSSQEFRMRLQEVESADGPCDLVFPLVDFGHGLVVKPPKAPVIPYRGLLFDGFPPIALPAPGIEMRVGSLGEWSAVSRTAPVAMRVDFAGAASSRRLAALNTGATQGLEGWTRGFGPFARSLVYGPKGGDALWAILRPSRIASGGSGKGWHLEGRFHRNVSPAMLPSDGIALRLEEALPERRAVVRGEARLEGGSLPPTCVAAVGGLHALVRDGQMTIAPEAAGVEWPYAWVGFSRLAGQVWFGVCDLNGARSRGMRPDELAPVLARNGLDAVGIVPAVVGGSALRWRDEWVGQPIGTPMAHMSAALVLHLNPKAPESANLLRDRRVRVEASNVSESGRNTAALHDGRTLAGSRLDTFWWARAADESKPLVVEIDLNEAVRVRRIELRGASSAGFSEQFDPPSWRWFVRDSSSSPWRVAASGDAASIVDGVWEHRVRSAAPVRRWRLEIDPPKGGGVVRVAEICLWEAGSP